MTFVSTIRLTHNPPSPKIRVKPFVYDLDSLIPEWIQHRSFRSNTACIPGEAGWDLSTRSE